MDLTFVRGRRCDPAFGRPRRGPAGGLAAAVAPVLAAVVLAVVLEGCASSRPPPPRVEAPPPAAVAPPPVAAPAPAAPQDSLSAEEVRDLAALQAETFRPPVGSTNTDLDDELERFLQEESDAILTEQVDYDIPIVINERVEYFIDYFQHRVSNSFAKWLARAPQVVPYMRARFQQEGLPEDLIYLSLIESGLSPIATSRANAVGYWQFIAGTARRYGLRVDRWIDERRDLERSTEAAIAYLKDLHQMFGSWYLAAAAYNSGEGKIQRAIERYESENLWELAEFSYLRRETKDYVPKLIAATLIAKEPEKYGFGGVPPLPFVAVDTVIVPTQTDLRVIAAAAGTSTETIRSLNPSLRSHATPPDVRDFAVNVPRGGGQVFAERLARVPPSQRVLERVHVVRRGDTPSRIAAKYGVTTSELMAENGIRNPRKLRVGQRLQIPRTGADDLLELPAQLAQVSQPREGAGTGGDGGAGASLPTAAEPGSSEVQDAGLAASGSAAPPEPTEVQDAGPAASGSAAPPEPIEVQDAELAASGSAAPPAGDAFPPGTPGPDSIPPTAVAQLADGPEPAVAAVAGPSVRTPEAAGASGSGAGTPQPDAVAGAGIDDGAAEPGPADAPLPSAEVAAGGSADAAPAAADEATSPSLGAPADSAYAAAALPPTYAGEPVTSLDELRPSVRTGQETRSEARESAAVPAEPAALEPRTIRYRVRPGDSLYRIALGHAVTVDDLRLWNPGLGSRIYPGNVLVINLSEGRDGRGAAGHARAPGLEAPRPDGNESDATREPLVLRVEPGDTLWAIARRHGVTLDQLRQWNGLRGSSIHTGDRLVLFPAGDARP